MSENQQTIPMMESGVVLGINSLYNQPLLVVVPSSGLHHTDDGVPEITYSFIHKIDEVLRGLRKKSPEDAYQLLERKLGITIGSEPASFWHFRHWDDNNEEATFIVKFSDEHESPHLSGKYLLASSRHKLFASPCLAPQVTHVPPLMVLVDDEGNMVFPFDEPLNKDGVAVPLGPVQLPTAQFSSHEQSLRCSEILEDFGYTVELI